MRKITILTERTNWLFIIMGMVVVLTSCNKENETQFPVVENKPPIAYAGVDKILILPEDSILLEGSASSQTVGAIISYSWTKIAGPSSFHIIRPKSAKTIVNQLIEGAYQFELIVKDNSGLSAKDTVQVVVDNPAVNQEPVARAGADQIITLPINSIILNGSASADPDNNINGYQWIKISGPSTFNIANELAIQTQVTNLVQGTYQFELKVTDAAGLFSKDTVSIMVVVDVTSASCNMQLTPFSTLSIARRNISTATAGSKILFAGGNLNFPGTAPIVGTSRVDIYDTTSKTWSTAELSQARTEMAVAVAGNKIFFAGGFVYGATESSRVDIYDVSTNIWSTAELSLARESVVATVVGNNIYFAGGWEFYDTYDIIDIYNISTNSWSTIRLPYAGSNLTAATLNNQIFYAPGWIPSNKIQVYNITSNSWTDIIISESKSYISSIAAGNKIFWAGGLKGNVFSDEVQIYDVNTGTSGFHKLSQARIVAEVLMKNNKILFMGGYSMPSGNQWSWSNKIDVYDLSKSTWSDFSICPTVSHSSAISVRDRIYIAGGYYNGALSSQVWMLDF